jgi:hypothetical protein
MSRIKCFFVENTGRTIKKQYSEGPVWRRTDTGEEFEYLSEVPPGGMWFADWYTTDKHSLWVPQLEYVLVVKTPNGDWVIDAQANNCTMLDDPRQERHHCWIIEGTTPPGITVSKNGVTCQAGAGSIQKGNYHAFLRNGYLEEC